MATSTTKKTSTTGATAKKTTSKSTSTKAKASVVDTPVTESPKAEVQKKIVPKDIDMNQYVTVYNGFQGKLIYVSNRTGEVFVWSEFGDEQEIELRELRNAKNSAKKFFINNWFMFEEDWIIDFLGVGQFYKDAVKIEDFDDVFFLPADEIGEVLGSMSKGQQRSAAYRARQLINDGAIDSNKAISAIEKALNIELIER